MTHQYFSSWARTHRMSVRDSWLVQNCLGSILGFDHPEALEAKKKWEKIRRKKTSPASENVAAFFGENAPFCFPPWRGEVLKTSPVLRKKNLSSHSATGDAGAGSSMEKLQKENKMMREALIDLQGEHCDTHCGNGEHVTLCINASRAVTFSLQSQNLLPEKS